NDIIHSDMSITTTFSEINEQNGRDSDWLFRQDSFGKRKNVMTSGFNISPKHLKLQQMQASTKLQLDRKCVSGAIKIDKENISTFDEYESDSDTESDADERPTIRIIKNRNKSATTNTDIEHNYSTERKKSTQLTVAAVSELLGVDVPPTFKKSVQQFNSYEPCYIICINSVALSFRKRYVNEEDAEIIWDATGGIIQCKATRKKVLYYEMTAANPVKRATSIPLTFLLSENHDLTTVKHWLELFKALYKKQFAQSNETPFPVSRYIINDRAQVFVQTALRVFNNETFTDFNQRAYRIITGSYTSDDLRKTIPHACTAHIMKDFKILLKIPKSAAGKDSRRQSRIFSPLELRQSSFLSDTQLIFFDLSEEEEGEQDIMDAQQQQFEQDNREQLEELNKVFQETKRIEQEFLNKITCLQNVKESAAQIDQWLNSVEIIFRKLNYPEYCWAEEAIKHLNDENVKLWFEKENDLINQQWDKFKQQLLKYVQGTEELIVAPLTNTAEQEEREYDT
ncbi:unnamed protein product, partial [Didymodactylos carnosus]